MSAPALRRPLRLLALGAVLLAVPLSACSSDDEPATTSTTEAAEDTAAPDANGDTTDTTLVDSELCALAAESDPDLSNLPELLPEELRADAEEFVDRYEAWKAGGGDLSSAPQPSEEIVAHVSAECFPDVEPPADAPGEEPGTPVEPPA
jgi:hypothetical protein